MSRVAAILSLSLALAAGTGCGALPAESGLDAAERPLRSLGADARELRDHFDRETDLVRLVTLLSPS